MTTSIVPKPKIVANLGSLLLGSRPSVKHSFTVWLGISIPRAMLSFYKLLGRVSRGSCQWLRLGIFFQLAYLVLC